MLKNLSLYKYFKERKMDLKIDRTKYILNRTNYIQEEHKKNLLVLHYTAGSTASGAFETWNNKAIVNIHGEQVWSKVSTPYILDRDGTIYEVYDPKFYSYHLGINSDPKHLQHKRSVSIEIVNFGSLMKNKNKLYAWPNNYNQEFCDVSETEKYIQVPDYRGYSYYAMYTPKQLEALPSLAEMLCDRFEIPKVFNAQKLDQTDLKYFSTFNGMCSHTSFRNDKCDTGPALNWNIFEGKFSAI